MVQEKFLSFADEPNASWLLKLLGTFYVSGDTNPKLKHKEN